MKKSVFLIILILLTVSHFVEARCSGDCQNGYGTKTWSGRGEYTGYWLNAKKHGQGKDTWSDGTQYEGAYQNGKRHGQGTYIWKNGKRYVGDWKNGKRHGEGTLYHSEGSEQAGLWENGRYMGPGDSKQPIAVPKQSPSISVHEKRTALVIGNSQYRTAPLRNPENDAREMAKALQEVGFKVTSLLNIEQKQMKKAINEFGKKLTDVGGVGLFYFAGHGLQASGKNYLIPVDADIRKESDIELDGVMLARVMYEMENARNRMNIIILDACRDNPFSSDTKSSFRSFARTRGFAAVPKKPPGTYIAFATAPGDVAIDQGDQGKHGLFTQELFKAIRTPGLEIDDIFKRVRKNVQKKSNGLQMPWSSSSIMRDFYFKVD